MTGTNSPPKTILIVDDDVKMTFVLRELVEQFGYEVMAAHSIAEAVAVVQESAEVDLLMTDIRLRNGEDGFELARQVRALLPALPVIFVTGHACDPSAAKKAEDHLLLLKPVQPLALRNAIHLALGRD